jgi:hypothetical protein
MNLQKQYDEFIWKSGCLICKYENCSQEACCDFIKMPYKDTAGIFVPQYCHEHSNKQDCVGSIELVELAEKVNKAYKNDSVFRFLIDDMTKKNEKFKESYEQSTKTNQKSSHTEQK